MKEHEKNLILQMIRNDFAEVKKANDYDINWTNLLNFVSKHRIFPLYYSAVKNIVPQSIYISLQIKEETHKKRISSMCDSLHELYWIAQSNKFRFVLIKGLALSKIIYDDLYSRQINDIDILIDEYEGIKADSLMRAIGYVQPCNSDWKKGNISLLPFLSSHGRDSKHYYEYYKFGQPYSKVEIHRTLAGYKPIINEILWTNAVTDIDGMKINTMNLEHTFVYLFINAHNASETKQSLQKKIVLRDYLDIYFFCKKYIDQINWRSVADLLRRSDSITRFSVIINNLIDLYGDSAVINRLVELGTEYGVFDKNIKSLVDDMNFIDKLFSTEERVSSVNRKLKDDFTRKQLIGKHTSILPFSKPQNLENYKKFENDANIDIKYNVSYLHDCLVLSLWLQEQLRIDFDKYLFSFTIFNNDYKNPTLYSNYEVTYDNGEYIVYGLDTDLIYDPNTLRETREHYPCEYEYDKESNIIHIFVPFSRIGSNPINDDSIVLACVTNFYRHVYANIYHTFNDGPVNLLRAKPLKFK